MKNDIENPSDLDQIGNTNYKNLDLFADELDTKINAGPAGQAGCTSTLSSGTSASTAGCLCSFGCIACACTS